MRKCQHWNNKPESKGLPSPSPLTPSHGTNGVIHVGLGRERRCWREDEVQGRVDEERDQKDCANLVALKYL